jgi:formylglycine-generating enzyme required for sulfatase activity
MRSGILFSIVVFVCIVGIASADTFGAGDTRFLIEFVNISGDSGDLGSWPAGNGYTFSGVNHGDYRMGKFEITNEQWSKFMNEYGMVTGIPYTAYDKNPYWTGTDVPTNMVSWYEVAQFVNWLNTSTGHAAAYKFTGTQGTSDYTFAVWEPNDFGCDGSNPYRNSNAYYFLPREDEWVKAAYWSGTSLQTWASPGDITPTQSDWNFYDKRSPINPYNPWTIGSGAEELNGTFDMMGNVSEWMESPGTGIDLFLSDSPRVNRGGSYWGRGYIIIWLDVYQVSSSIGQSFLPKEQREKFGFRVASVLSDENFKPIAYAGDDQIIEIPIDEVAEIKLDGTGSYDNNGDALEYFWYNDANELIATVAEPLFSFGIGEYEFTLIVNDDTEDSEPDEVVITVLQMNRPPMAHAGEDQAVYAWVDGLAEVKFDGTSSYDEDGDALEYYWYDGNDLIAMGVEPNVLLGVGEHVIDLIVNDGIEDSVPNSCSVTVLETIEAEAVLTPQVLHRDSGRPHVIGRIEFADEQMPVLDPNEPMLLLIGQAQIGDERQMLDYSKKEKAWYLAGFFDNAALMEVITEDGDVEVILAAKLLTGQWIFGTDIVTVK